MLVGDAYERRARLVPGLMVLFPLPVTIVALGLKAEPVVATATALLSTIGGPFILASVVRTRGLALQARLDEEWDGLPSRHALRRTIWRAAAASATGVALPDVPEEANDPRAADGYYDAAVARLRSLQRDTERFPLLFEELRNYGYERNLLAVRPIGAAVALLSCVLMAGLASLPFLTHQALAPLLALVCAAALDFTATLFWLGVPSRPRVLMVAKRYTERLMDGAIQLQEELSPPRKKKS